MKVFYQRLRTDFPNKTAFYRLLLTDFHNIRNIGIIVLTITVTFLILACIRINNIEGKPLNYDPILDNLMAFSFMGIFMICMANAYLIWQYEWKMRTNHTLFALPVQMKWIVLSKWISILATYSLLLIFNFVGWSLLYLLENRKDLYLAPWIDMRGQFLILLINLIVAMGTLIAFAFISFLSAKLFQRYGKIVTAVCFCICFGGLLLLFYIGTASLSENPPDFLEWSTFLPFLMINMAAWLLCFFGSTYLLEKKIDLA